VFAANPARVPEGPKQGLRTLPNEEDVARRLYASLSGEAKKQATIAASAAPDFNEVVTGQQNAKPNKVPVVGVRHADLSADQKGLLRELMQVYLRKYAADVATAMLEEAEKAGMDDIRFAWAGPAEQGKQHYYRVQGPTFIIEYCNVQNNGNHIHSLWRNAKADFAVPAGN
jgi:hypothetical protein